MSLVFTCYSHELLYIYCRKDHRRFILNNLSKVGMSKKDVLEHIIEEEVEALKSIMKQDQEKEKSIKIERR